MAFCILHLDYQQRGNEMLVYACSGQAQVFQKQAKASRLYCESAAGCKASRREGSSDAWRLAKLTGEMFSVNGSVLFSTPDLNW